MASSEQLSQAAFIYEQMIVALWDRPEALSDTQMWSAGAEKALLMQLGVISSNDYRLKENMLRACGCLNAAVSGSPRANKGHRRSRCSRHRNS